MELFAIILSAPAAFVASAAYCVLIVRLTGAWTRLRAPLLVGSVAVLSLIAAEALVLILRGAARAHSMLGASYYAAHLVLFVVGTPALANVLVLGRYRARIGKWYIAAPICALFAMATTVMQYTVSEAIHGIS